MREEQRETTETFEEVDVLPGSRSAVTRCIRCTQRFHTEILRKPMSLDDRRLALKTATYRSAQTGNRCCSVISLCYALAFPSQTPSVCSLR